ncbi:MAG: type II secretion system F family protein [Acetobacteraceae bacterium]
MATFEYRALSAAGEIVSGEIDGPDTKTVLDRLHEQALFPIHATEKRPPSRFRLELSAGSGRGFPSGQLALFVQQLARLLRAGLPLDRSLEILTSLVDDRRARRIVQRLLDRVRDGAGLAEAMSAEEGVFPSLCISMVRAGEESGALRVVLARVADFLVRSEAMRQKVVSASIYPTILTIVAFGSVVLILTLVLPQFEQMFADAGPNLPTTTWLVMQASRGLREYWWVLLAGIGLLAGTLQWLSRKPSVLVWRDRVALRLPLIGSLVSRFEIARFSRSLGVLLANGVPAARALALAGATIGNLVFVTAIETLATRFKEGEGMARSLDQTGRFPVLAVQLIQIGEETGRLEDMLTELADIYEQEVERTLERLLALMVPAITVTMGVVVALIMAAVMTAMVSINELVV